MKPKELLEFLAILEKLKCNTRHCYTTTNRQESVAEHSWRLSVMAMLLGEKFPEIDIAKVIKMCLIHDLGEAITGDIPCFDKSNSDEKVEDFEVDVLLKTLPQPTQNELVALFCEMRELKTQEARLFKALDKIEAVIAHNESDIRTWVDIEYTLNLVYGEEECSQFPYLKELRELCKQVSIDKIKLANEK